MQQLHIRRIRISREETTEVFVKFTFMQKENNFYNMRDSPYNNSDMEKKINLPVWYFKIDENWFFLLAKICSPDIKKEIMRNFRDAAENIIYY